MYPIDLGVCIQTCNSCCCCYHPNNMRFSTTFPCSALLVCVLVSCLIAVSAAPVTPQLGVKAPKPMYTIKPLPKNGTLNHVAISNGTSPDIAHLVRKIETAVKAMMVNDEALRQSPIPPAEDTLILQQHVHIDKNTIHQIMNKLHRRNQPAKPVAKPQPVIRVPQLNVAPAPTRNRVGPSQKRP
jgi:hypothetical protein